MHASGSTKRCSDSVSARAMAAGDSHPVAVWCEGEAFSRPPGTAARHERALARRCTAAFLELVRELEPGYAAITLDQDLRCSSDLEPVPEFALRDAFVATSFVGRRRSTPCARLALRPTRRSWTTLASTSRAARRSIARGEASA